MNIIVNGGTRGIGLEIVRFLLRNQGHNIIATGRHIKGLEELAAGHRNLHPIMIDLSDLELHSGKLLDKISSVFDKIDVLINCAGSLIVKDFLDISDKESRQIVETNFFGPASLIRLVFPFLRSGSHIVNISSMGGFQGASKYRGLSYYSASKAAMACLTECLATEFAGAGIKVNCLAIGAVQTEMFEEAFPGLTAPVTAEEMGRFVSDFALNAHKFFNGKILPVAVSNP